MSDPQDLPITGKPNNPPRILAVVLDFDSWELAGKWSYSASYALIDGLRAAGCDVVILPSLYLGADPNTNPWLDARSKILEERTFDQVWVWITHSFYDLDALQWLSLIAPVRVAVLMESLDYSPSDIQEIPRLAGRKDHVYRQIRGMTHAISGDERDLAMISAELGLPTHAFLPMLPRDLAMPEVEPVYSYAVFLGTVYGKRRKFFTASDEVDLLRLIAPPEAGTDLPARFDGVTEECLSKLRDGHASPALAASYLERIIAIRLAIMRRSLSIYNSCLAGVSLPALYTGVTGRIVELMAAATAVLLPASEKPPKGEAILVDGHNVLCYDATRPRDLERQALRLKSDPALRKKLIANAKATFVTRLSSEAQMSNILTWLSIPRDGTSIR